MRNLVGLLSALFVLTAVAAGPTIEQADSYYSQRGERTYSGEDYVRDYYSRKAYKAYKFLAEKESDKMAKMKLMVKLSAAYYFFGTHSFEANGSDHDKKTRKGAHEAGTNAAESVVLELEERYTVSKKVEFNRMTVEEKQTYAEAAYWFSANLGQWGKANGVADSLFKLPKLKDYLGKIYEAGLPQTMNYGLNRVIGRVAWTLGSKQKVGDNKRSAEEWLEEGYQKSIVTINGSKVCPKGTNVTYYADALISAKKKDEAKKVLGSWLVFVKENGLKALGEADYAENKDDYKIAVETYKTL